jgi:uncharacterized protein YfkK (UPF0435 family)
MLRPDVESARKSSQDALTAVTKERQLNASKVGRLTDIANVIEKKFAETSPHSGPIGALSGIIDIGMSGLQATPNQVNDYSYRSFVKGLRAQLARAMGDVGNLSEPEQKAAMNLIPGLLDTKETAAKKLSNLRDLISTIQTKNNEQLIQPAFTGGRSAQPAFTGGNMVLPETVQTTSQAVQYLTGQGMTKEQAIEWIRSQ